jgi:hypothetical protein
MQPDATSPDVEVFDRHSDPKLIVGENKAVFQVCSRSLARSSPFWETLLYGPFAEGKAQHKTDDWEVALPQDNASALRIILLAVHGRVNDVPKGTMSFDLLCQITELCDKYDMLATLVPFWGRWLPSKSARQYDPQDASAQELTQQVWLSYNLGDMWGFRHAIFALVDRAATLDNGGLCLDADPKDNLDTNCYLRSLDLLGKSTQIIFVIFGHNLTSMQRKWDEPVEQR